MTDKIFEWEENESEHRITKIEAVKCQIPRCSNVGDLIFKDKIYVCQKHFKYLLALEKEKEEKKE